jgi:catechol 2,3-dioxygenase-like lactoylglutathione lyase family enzyme
MAYEPSCFDFGNAVNCFEGENVPDLYPRAVTHVGLTVTDMDAGIRWYGEILGFPLLFGPVDLVADDSHFGKIVTDIFGPECRKGRLAQLSGSNGVCIELFQFEDPASEKQKEDFEYWKVGIFHFTIIEPKIEDLVSLIANSGGKRRSQVWTLFPDKPYKMAYCEDPFGNMIEIYSHSTEHTWSNL